MSAEENKAAQRRIIEDVINGKNLDAADEFFSEGHTLYPESSGVGRGPEGMKRAFAGACTRKSQTSASRSRTWWPKGTRSPCA